jgi:hypothetical protein
MFDNVNGLNRICWKILDPNLFGAETAVISVTSQMRRVMVELLKGVFFSPFGKGFAANSLEKEVSEALDKTKF